MNKRILSDKLQNLSFPSARVAIRGTVVRMAIAEHDFRREVYVWGIERYGR